MGSVWLAEHLLLKTEVAVKLLSAELEQDPEALARFRREATAIAQLKSPHVVRIHDVGVAEGTPFFVMERLEGEDLAHRLDRVQRLPLGVVTAIIVQMCKALARVHELGVVHRDLKPGNVFLTDVEGDLVIKLVDFGIAKQRDADALNATSDGAILGTPLYMSPEQVLSTRDVTAASDLYSLGVVAYECLAGEPPFSGETLGALHVAIAHGQYAPISVVDPSLPKALDAWFSRALAPTPTQRFASAQEMSETFMAAARGRSSLPAMPVTARDAEGEAAGARAARAATATEAIGMAPTVAMGSMGSMAPAMATAAAAPPWLRALMAVAGGLAVIALVVGVVLGARAGRAARAAEKAARVERPVAEDAGGNAEANANASANANAAASANANANASATANATATANANVTADADAGKAKDTGKGTTPRAAKPAPTRAPKDHGF